ncbi:SUPPRESSOR OF GAMMA RESPONSE 1 [Amaranthus tricolor]|uniref:SUPPRESSOR OF GAMMA RESPONSE 1 n=1 Tax=Amaranthus tricolor TaxID=29722 RepID=UPI00258E35C0|nr:SUPPRESSOR OF GAMMA RESPONSE 1 [Amaranthus tricolor]
MAGPSWLVDGNRIATKIKCASGTCDTGKIKWKSNPTRLCPSCQHTIDNNDVVQKWPGLPRGVKFDPTDQEIIQHLLAKSGIGNETPHPFINEFIPTVEEEDGICYTHPQNLPGVKQDGTASHFFHRAIKAYNTGTRKRRKIHVVDLGDVRWHKTGRTKPVSLNGVQKGCKKIMVLYVSSAKGGKSEKTNWVTHQYHLGTEEDEKDGEYVISKVFYQQQQGKQGDKTAGYVSDAIDEVSVKLDPVTPEPSRHMTPEPPQKEIQLELTEKASYSCIDSVTQDQRIEIEKDHDMGFPDEVQQPKTQQTETTKSSYSDAAASVTFVDDQALEHDDNLACEENLWDSESQFMINSQQLAEGMSFCDDFLRSQSPDRGETADNVPNKKSVLSEYAKLGPEDLKKDLEECQNLVLDPANIDLDTPPDFRLSQLEFGSQESFGSWGLGKICD